MAKGTTKVTGLGGGQDRPRSPQLAESSLHFCPMKHANLQRETLQTVYCFPSFKCDIRQSCQCPEPLAFIPAVSSSITFKHNKMNKQKSLRYTCARSSLIHNSWKAAGGNPRVPRQMRACVGRHPVEYHSAFKKKEILTQAATQMNLEKDIMLSKTSQSRKHQFYMMPLTCNT